jgi:hypothetical protein
MGIALEAMQKEREKAGQLKYDSKTGQFMRYEPNNGFGGFVMGRDNGKWIPVGGPGFGQTVNTPTPPADFNNLPKQPRVAAQPYVRPNAPTQNTGSGYMPQFDPSFIQQMLAQRFGNQQPNAGMPAAVQQTLTPGAQQTYGGYQGQGQNGLAGLRSLSNPAAMGQMGGTPSAPF